MEAPAYPENELDRLANLASFEVLDTPFEPVFDQIASLAQMICGTPIALMSLIDLNRQWFKAARGFDALRETPREISFCGHAILQDELFQVTDAPQDVRFHDNPLVTGPLGVRFYAGMPIKSPEGFNLGTLCVLSDQPKQLNEEQKEMMRQLAQVVSALLKARRSEARYALLGQVLDRLGDEIMLVEEESGRCLFGNHAARIALCCTGDAITARHLPELLSDVPAERLEQIMQPLRQGETDVVHVEHRRPGGPDGSHPVETRMQRLTMSSKPVLVLITHDISERKALEAMKREFIAIIGHELRTPLTSINGALGMLKSGLGGEVDESAQTLVDIAQRNAEGLIRLISDFLDIEKVEFGAMAFHPERLSAAMVMEDALQAASGFASAMGVTLEREPCDDLAVTADRGRLQQVLGNLISNAVKFSPKDKPVTLRCERVGEMVRFSVIDQGPGVPAQFQARLFEKFAQADTSTARAREGTGLGLAIVKKFTERMKGRVGFASMPGRDTRFFVDLPAA
ncbi:PAS domain S-box-containing protein [Noviherbaspirillum humi]|uniref:histidine kinase n=1 Tax=Noviherbaspirillum humi TaxID=1688639 RepID=A0A239J4W7_9BURK|nr:ATP-binding protein [Noviherbaspirillum humi]SNT00528.1 PAS domain S-box-containing protein [Noviherbaspirillum humi]